MLTRDNYLFNKKALLKFEFFFVASLQKLCCFKTKGHYFYEKLFY